MAQHFGQRLQSLRHAKVWTVYQAAKQAGIPSQILYRLEDTATLGKVQVVTLRKLAKAYQVTIDYLIHGVADSDDEDAHAA